MKKHEQPTNRLEKMSNFFGGSNFSKLNPCRQTTAEGYNAENKRIGGIEDAYRTGTHGWRTVLASGKVPPQAVRFGVEYYIAPKTTGRFEVDAFRAELEVWRRPE